MPILGDFGGRVRRARALGLFLGVVACGCDARSRPAPGEMDATCSVVATPEPVRQGSVDFRVRLPPEFLPDSGAGKSLSFDARQVGKTGSGQVGQAKELFSTPGTIEFALDINSGGDWIIDLVATWPDGRLFTKERVTIHDVP